jgi:hypothetical protein
VRINLQKAIADFSQDGFNVALAIDNNPATGWAVAPQFGKPHTAIFEFRAPLTHPNGSTFTITLDQQFTGKDHNIGKFRLSLTTLKPPLTLQTQPEAIVKILATPPEQRNDAQKTQLAAYHRSIDSELARLKQVLADNPKPADKRLLGAQDLAWALLNSPAFLFNH